MTSQENRTNGVKLKAPIDELKEEKKTGGLDKRLYFRCGYLIF